VSLIDDRLAALPESLAQLLRDAITISSAAPDTWDADFEQTEEQAWELAMRAAGFEPSSGWKERVIPLADELQPGQRAVIEVLGLVPDLPLNAWPVYAAAWLCRRWLGIDPPGVIFSPIEWEGRQLPLIHVLRELLRTQRDDEARNLLAQRDLAARLELLVDFTLAPLDIDLPCQSTLISELSTELGALTDESLAEAAKLAASRLLDVGADNRRKLDDDVAMMVFTALVAAKVPIEPRHDALLRLSWGDFSEATLRNIAAIPESRREHVVFRAMSEIAFPNYRWRSARLVLSKYPFPSVVEGVLTWLDRLDNPAETLRELDKIAKQHPVLAPIVAAAHDARPTAPTLALVEILDPVKLLDLDAVARRQLEIANRLYGGAEMTAEAILGQTDEETDETINPRFLQRRRIVDESGAPAYDAWLYNVDSGTIFAAGTEEVVAEIIQFGLETQDPALRIALPDVLAERSVAKKKAAKKKKAKKKVAKKKVAKKKVAKKKVAKKKVAKKKVAKKKSRR
jgi:hypothetical protein